MVRKLCSDEELIHAYCDLRLPLTQIAEKFGYRHYNAVSNRLQSLGISHRPHPFSEVPLTDLQDLIITGTLLGDGSIERRSPTGCRLRISHTPKHLEYLQWLSDQLQPFSLSLQWGSHKTKEKYHEAVDLKTRTLPQLCSYREAFYPEGKKIVPPRIHLEPLSIAIWFMDDGSYNPSNGRISIATCSFSPENHDRLLNILFYQFDLKATIWKMGGYPHIALSRVESKKFIDIVAPHIIPCMRYKINC